MKQASASVVNISKKFVDIVLSYIRQTHKKDFELFKVQFGEIVPEFSIVCKNINDNTSDVLIFMFNEVGFLKRIAYIDEGLLFDRAVTSVVTCKTGKISEVIHLLKSIFTPMLDIDEAVLDEVKSFLREANPLGKAAKTFVKNVTQPVADPVEDVAKKTAKAVTDTGKEVVGAVSQVAGAYIPKSVKTAYANAKDVYNKEKQNSKDNKETPTEKSTSVADKTSVIDKAKAAYRSTFNRGNTYKIAREQFSKACEKIIGSATVATEDMMTQMLLLWFKHPILDGKVKARTAVDSNSKYLEFLSDVMYSDTVKKAVTRSVYLKVLDKLLPDTDFDKGVLSDPVSPLPKYDWDAFGKKIDNLIQEYKEQAAKELSIQQSKFGEKEIPNDMRAAIRDKFAAYTNVLEQMKVAFCNPGKSQGNDAGTVWIDSRAGMGKTTFVNDVLQRLNFRKVELGYTGNTPSTVKAEGYYDAKDNEYGYIPAKKSEAVPGISYDVFWTRKFPIVVVDDAPNMLRGLKETGQLLMQAGDLKRVNFSQKDAISPVTTRAKFIFLSNETVSSIMKDKAQGVNRRIVSVSFNFTEDQVINSLKFESTYPDSIKKMELQDLLQDKLEMAEDKAEEAAKELYKYLVVNEAIQTQLAYAIASSSGTPQHAMEKKDSPVLVPFETGYANSYTRMGNAAKWVVEYIRNNLAGEKTSFGKKVAAALSVLAKDLRDIYFPGKWEVMKHKKAILTYAGAKPLISAIETKKNNTIAEWETLRYQFWGDPIGTTPSPPDNQPPKDTSTIKKPNSKKPSVPQPKKLDKVDVAKESPKGRSSRPASKDKKEVPLPKKSAVNPKTQEKEPTPTVKKKEDSTPIAEIIDEKIISILTPLQNVKELSKPVQQKIISLIDELPSDQVREKEDYYNSLVSAWANDEEYSSKSFNSFYKNVWNEGEFTLENEETPTVNKDVKDDTKPTLEVEPKENEKSKEDEKSKEKDETAYTALFKKLFHRIFRSFWKYPAVGKKKEYPLNVKGKLDAIVKELPESSTYREVAEKLAKISIAILRGRKRVDKFSTMFSFRATDELNKNKMVKTIETMRDIANVYSVEKRLPATQLAALIGVFTFLNVDDSKKPRSSDEFLSGLDIKIDRLRSSSFPEIKEFTKLVYTAVEKSYNSNKGKILGSDILEAINDHFIFGDYMGEAIKELNLKKKKE